MRIVGVGCGPGMLTEAAIGAIRAARLIYGSDRAIDLANPHIPEDCEVHTITEYRSLRSLPDHAVVLSTGDPMLAGLGYLGGEIIPGISSMQVAFARLGIPLAKGVVVNAHGRDHAAALDETIGELGRGKTVFLIADPRLGIGSLAARMAAAGLCARIAACERLGYPDERIRTGTPGDPPVTTDDLFALVIGDW
jgi:cobalt-precorrin-7 (C5)-methyltransferase